MSTEEVYTQRVQDGVSRRIAAHVRRMMGREARCLIYWPVVESKSASFITGMKAELFHQWAMGEKAAHCCLGEEQCFGAPKAEILSKELSKKTVCCDLRIIGYLKLEETHENHRVQLSAPRRTTSN